MSAKTRNTRNTRAAVAEVMWVDDLVVEWPGPRGPCRIQAVLDFTDADVRLVLRHSLHHGKYEEIIQSGLGNALVHTSKLHLDEGDEIALQWRALTPTTAALSEVAELSVESIDDQFAT